MKSLPSSYFLAVLAAVSVAAAGCTPSFIPANRLDADGDGFFAPRVVSDLAGQTVQQLVEDKLDCDDSKDEVFPDAAELCDGFDNDCDRVEVCPDGEMCPGSLHETERDDDLDGFTECGLNPETGEISVEGRDCNDDRDAYGFYESPGRTEICAMPPVPEEELDGICRFDPDRPKVGLDDDCDGVLWEGEHDMDQDGYAGCHLVDIDEGGEPLGIDCDDNDPTINPGIHDSSTDCALDLLECVAGHDDPDDDPRYSATNCTLAVVDEVPWYPDCDLDGDGSEDGPDDPDDEDHDWLFLCANETPLGHDTTDKGCLYNGLQFGNGGNWINGSETLPWADLHTDCNDSDNRLNGLDIDGDTFSLCEEDFYPGLDTAADDNPYVYPGACEVCDTYDNDLDGDVDEGYDMDGDGAFAGAIDLCPISPYDEEKFCDEELPVGEGNAYLTANLDCDDTDATLNNEDVDSDGVSTCAGDCNDGNSSITNTDVDGDGYTTCAVPPDCDDFDPALFPADVDGDGWTSCEGDCLDVLDDPATTDVDEQLVSQNVFPGNGVQCDGFWDTDCDGFTDPLESDDDADGSTECDGDCDDANPDLNGVDVDGDGWTTCQGDCDDADATVFPGAPNLCDGIDDNDCNGIVDPNEANDDNDGSSICDGDCNDFDATVDAADVDGDGWTSCEGDCDDNEPLENPGVDADGDGWNVCGASGVPADCDDTDDTLNWNDIDGDGSSTCSTVPDCDDLDPALNQLDVDSDGETSCDGDCNDGIAVMHTGGSEGATRDALDNDCDGTADEGLVLAGDLAITEMMIGAHPDSGDGYAEYVEVINTSASKTIDLRGWTVEVVDVGAGATTSWTFPSGVDEDRLLVAPGQRAVLARPTNDQAYGYDIADHYWSSPPYSDVGGEISLIFGLEVDWVGWDPTGCVSGCDGGTPNYAGGAPYWRPGWAMGLKETYVTADPAGNNDNLEKWCEEGDPLGPLNYGSPGAAAGTLGTCGTD